MIDLFQKKSAKERLWDWILEQKYIKTSMIIKWGTDNYSNRADRNARQLAIEHPGVFRRLTDEEKYRHFGLISEDVYIVENI